MKDRIETIIRDWLNREFKNPNAIPGPMLKGLAEEIDKHRFEIYNFTKEEYDLEDINMVADNNNTELTEDEIQYALNKYQKAQEYDDTSIYALEDIIKEIEANREKSDDSEREEESPSRTGNARTQLTTIDERKK